MTLVLSLPGGTPGQIHELLKMGSQVVRPEVLDLQQGGLHYFDALDSPVGLWNFNSTLNAVVGPNASVTFGTAVSFAEAVPGLVGLTIGSVCRVACAPDPSLLLLGDMSASFLGLFVSTSGTPIFLSHGGTAATSDGNKAYEVTLVAAGSNIPRALRFVSESGAGVVAGVNTSTAVTSPGVPLFVPFMCTWTRQANAVTAYINGKAISSPTVMVAPTDGSNGFLTFGSSATALSAASEPTLFSAAVFNYALSPAQELARYNRAFGDAYGIRT